MPALGPRVSYWANYEASWRPLAAAELASAITAQGPQLSSGAKAGGQGDRPGLIARRDLLGLSRSAALVTQGYTGPCAPGQMERIIKRKSFKRVGGRAKVRVPQEVV